MSIKQGDYLKRLRIERGLSQEGLSEVLGISRQSISKWEQGNSSPDIDNIKKLSEYFNVSVTSIINGEPDSFIQAEKAAQTSNRHKRRKNLILRRKSAAGCFLHIPFLQLWHTA